MAPGQIVSTIHFSNGPKRIWSEKLNVLLTRRRIAKELRNWRCTPCNRAYWGLKIMWCSKVVHKNGVQTVFFAYVPNSSFWEYSYSKPKICKAIGAICSIMLVYYLIVNLRRALGISCRSRRSSNDEEQSLIENYAQNLMLVGINSFQITSAKLVM